MKEKIPYFKLKGGPFFRKEKWSINLVTPEFFNDFIKEFPEYEGISEREMRKDLKDLLEGVKNEWIYNPLGIKLPHYGGELKLQYAPNFKKITDPVASEEVGERVNYINLTTRKKVARLKWERRRAVKFNPCLQYYAFEAGDAISKEAATYIKENPEKLRTSRNTMGGRSAWHK